jgi:Transposase DDE domain
VSSLARVATALQVVLTEVADAPAREVGFVRRVRKWTGALFVQTLVLGWLGNPDASLSELSQVAAKLGLAVSPQGLTQRFTERAAALLARVLAAAIEQVVAAEPVAVPLLQRFAGVFILDSSTIALPDGLADHWQGCGGRVAQGTQAALKATVELDLCRGRLVGPVVTAGRTQDRSSALQHAPLPRGALRLADLGFWRLEVFRRIAKDGGYWLSRLNVQVVIATADGARLDLPTWLPRQGARVDVPVRVGAGAKLAGRLLGVRVPQAVADERRRKLRAAAQREGQTPPAARLALADWTLLVTNAPEALMSVAEALVLARARWQIELLFKLWKDHGKVDESRSADKWRVLCEVYAKLIAMVVQHWVLLVGCWLFADRSLVEAAKTVRKEATCLVGAIRCHARLVEALAAIRRCLTAGCQIDRRKTKPNTYQLLLDPALGGLS